MTKDYNSKMAIGVGNDSVRYVSMRSICTSTNETNHLLTYGLGPCVGVAIVIKSGENNVVRLLAHMDMGQIIGKSFSNLKNTIRRLMNNMDGPAKQINISLVTTQSYQNIHNLNDKETELLAILLTEFQQLDIAINDINFVYSSQVQISPNGIISTYTEQQLEEHKKNILRSDLQSFGGYVHPVLNIYITNYGAYMGNCSLNTNSSDEEKKSKLREDYWQRYITDGYELVIGPSFNNPDCLAIYVSNWNDTSIHKYGTIPGCLKAKSFNLSAMPTPQKR